MQFALIETPWGPFGFVARDGRLVTTHLPDRAERTRRRIARAFPGAVEDAKALPVFRRQVAGYFKGKRVEFTIDIDVSDLPPFRRAVLEVCRGIPYGVTVSYADLARSVGKPGAARAVGGAMAHNPIPLVIPCHRVLRADGTLGGFSSPGGLTLKERMLGLERAEALDAGRSKARQPAAAVC